MIVEITVTLSIAPTVGTGLRTRVRTDISTMPTIRKANRTAKRQRYHNERASARVMRAMTLSNEDYSPRSRGEGRIPSAKLHRTTAVHA